MMSKGKVIGIAVATVVALTIVTLVVVMSKGGNKSNTPSSAQNSQSASSGSGSTSDSCPPVAANVVVFCGGTFNTITVSAGDEVVFLNNSNETVEPSSDPHPTHTKNPELNVGELAPGDRKSVTLQKTGTWGFHNHLNPSQKGTITVQ